MLYYYLFLLLVVASIIISPDFTKADFDAVVDYVLENDIKYPLFPILTPFPKTDLWHERRDEILSDNYTLYDYLHCVFKTRMPRQEFYEEHGRSRALKWYTFKRTFPLREIRLWPSKARALVDFYRKWRDCGSRIVDARAYLEDDLKALPAFAANEPEAIDGCSRASHGAALRSREAS